MAHDWEKLGGESGKDAPKGRWGRMLKMGGLGLSVSASEIARRVARRVGSNDDKSSEADTRARKRQAEKIVTVLGQLKGASMKLGQYLSSDPDLVPDEYLDTLTALQSTAPPMTFASVREEIEKALDRPLEAVFQTFDPEPIGAASIGQVHRGQLKTGESVAVKVQYPGIVDTIRSDLRNLRSIFLFGRTFIDKEKLDGYLEETERALLLEADYVQEAENLRRFYNHLKDREGVRCPYPFEEWTRPSVLVMEYIEGQKFDEAVESLDDDDVRMEMAQRFMETYIWMFHDLGEMHSDPHPGNFLWDEEDNLVFLDFGSVKTFEPGFTDGILDVLAAVWANDKERAAELYKPLGFGSKLDEGEEFDPDLIDQIHQILLTPFIEDRPFDFRTWRPRPGLQRLIFKDRRVMKLAPPSEALLYLRVIGGLKGFLTKSGLKVNMHRVVVDAALRRGRIKERPYRDD
ncbi:MAG: hypothetical protein CMH54_02465 [Myxococcales bacterium]|nr:hypothetical protein [Myxococcales bacterium]